MVGDNPDADINDIIAANASDINLIWRMKTFSQEKDHETERNASTIYFKYLELVKNLKYFFVFYWLILSFECLWFDF